MKNFSLNGSLALALTTGIASAWTPGVYTAPMPSKDFSVDTSRRNDVLSFWHGVYMASEGYQDRINWTGSHTASNHNTGAGTISSVFVDDVERRLNFYRALCGISSDVSVNSGSTVMITESDLYEPSPTTLKSEANQRSAYMIARAYIANDAADGASHNPPSNTIGWSEAAWNANAHSNITYGYFGPGAIDAYLAENDAGTTGADNSFVKHRRWSLYQSASDYATGDTPGRFVSGQPVQVPTNSFYVWHKQDELREVAPKFVAYPSEGYFPVQLNSRFWSLSYPGADFTNASITMQTQTGAFANITKVPGASVGGPGDSTVVWQVNSSAHNGITAPIDRFYDITVTGIEGAAVPSSYTYRVTLFDPTNFTSDQTLTGSESIPAGGQANYFLTRPDAAEAVNVDVFNRSTVAWTETAETGAATQMVPMLYKVTDPQATNPYTGYNHISPSITGGSGAQLTVVAGSRSFRLTHPVRWDILNGGTPDDIIELSREILTVPSQTSKVTFSYKRGYMTNNSRLAVEYTQNDGATWTTLGTPIQGKAANISNYNNLRDTTNQLWEGTLPQSSEPYRIRFRFYRQDTQTSNGSYVIAPHSEFSSEPTGIFFDTITTSNCAWLDLRKANEIPPTAAYFTLNAETAGQTVTNGSQHHVRMRTKLGNKWFKYGPTKVVTATNTPTPGFEGWLAYEYPILEGGFNGDHDGDGIPNAIEFAFHLDPLNPGTSSDIVAVDSSIVKAEPEVRISREIPSLRDGIIYGAEWSDTLAADSWSSEGVSVVFSGGIVTASAPAGPGRRFVRWKIATP